MKTLDRLPIQQLNILTFNLLYLFQGILNELPPLSSCPSWRPDPEEVARRRDLRDILVMSIDPIGCEDVDDALSVRKLENGNLEVGVHIADVTHFVPVNSLTDQV